MDALALAAGVLGADPDFVRLAAFQVAEGYGRLFRLGILGSALAAVLRFQMNNIAVGRAAACRRRL